MKNEEKKTKLEKWVRKVFKSRIELFGLICSCVHDHKWLATTTEFREWLNWSGRQLFILYNYRFPLFAAERESKNNKKYDDAKTSVWRSEHRTSLDLINQLVFFVFLHTNKPADQAMKWQKTNVIGKTANHKMFFWNYFFYALSIQH